MSMMHVVISNTTTIKIVKEQIIYMYFKETKELIKIFYFIQKKLKGKENMKQMN